MNWLDLLVALSRQGNNGQACDEVEQFGARPSGPVYQRWLHDNRPGYRSQQGVVRDFFAQVITAACILIRSQCGYLDNLDSFRDTSCEKSTRGAIVECLECLLAPL